MPATRKGVSASAANREEIRRRVSALQYDVQACVAGESCVQTSHSPRSTLLVILQPVQRSTQIAESGSCDPAIRDFNLGQGRCYVVKQVSPLRFVC